MKNDLATAIGVGIIGIIIGFVVCNLFLTDSESVSYKMINANVTMQLVEPDDEVFNVKALNPTVEVYVGDCAEYDSYGNCVEDEGGQ